MRWKKCSSNLVFFAFLITSWEALNSTKIFNTILKSSHFFYSINQTRFILHCFSNIVGITISDILRLCEKTTYKIKTSYTAGKKDSSTRWQYWTVLQYQISSVFNVSVFNYLFIPPFFFSFVKIDAIASKYHRYF